MPNFATLDLNLLRVFDALMEHRSATRAGDQLGVTQSAISHALARLRELLDDDLFLRTPAGMEPTPRARRLAPRLRDGLLQLQAALSTEAFEPLTAEGTLTIAANPYACTVLLPAVLGRLRAAAPGIVVLVLHSFRDLVSALHAGRLSLAIAGFGQAPDPLGVQVLMQETLVWVMRADHPMAQAPLTLERLAAIPHLVRGVADPDAPAADGMVVEHGLERRVAQDDGGALGSALAALGLVRRIGLTVPDSHAALAIVGETDLAALVPRRLAVAAAARGGLRMFDPPYDSPAVPLSMVWHRGHGSDPANEWLRGLVQQVAAAV